MGDDQKKISVVTISLNQGEFLEQAICSVLDQDYDNIEYIVVDPGSSDDSRNIIDKYNDRIAHVILDPDDGPPDGLNKGFAKATGDIFCYLNADDLFLPGAFRSAVAAFEQNPSFDVVSAHGFVIDRTGHVLRRFRSTEFDALRYAYGAAVVIQQSTFFRKQAFLDVGGFNVSNRTSWDGELILDMALAGKKFGLIEDYWSCFRMYESSLSGSQRLREVSVENWSRYFEKVMGRKEKPFDQVLRGLVRLEKWLRHPRTFLLQVWEKIAGAPRVGPF